MNQYQPITIALQQAVTFDGETLTKLTMRPPTTNDVLIAQRQSSTMIGGQVVSDDAEHEAVLFANLTGTTREVVGSLQMYDFSQLQKAYDCFLEPLPQYAAKCALLFPSFAEESLSTSLEPSPSPSSTTG
ncbi:phage tail assembly protein [Vibrio sp. ER1A]|uniref:phage tail assembly protein n=1 Tax=Vibrio sp. ER1A TaxID=1517681 RepID=UPI00057133DD|nr:phage tail assembly protein [Vibrio sp. ER1A]